MLLGYGKEFIIQGLFNIQTVLLTDNMSFVSADNIGTLRLSKVKYVGENNLISFIPNVTPFSLLSLSGWNRKIIRVEILILSKLSNTINGYLTLVGRHYLSSIVESFVISTIRPIFTWKFATSKRSTWGYLEQWADSWSLSFISPRSVKERYNQWQG